MRRDTSFVYGKCHHVIMSWRVEYLIWALSQESRNCHLQRGEQCYLGNSKWMTISPQWWSDIRVELIWNERYCSTFYGSNWEGSSNNFNTMACLCQVKLHFVKHVIRIQLRPLATFSSWFGVWLNLYKYVSFWDKIIWQQLRK